MAACAPLEMDELVFDQSCAVFATVLCYVGAWQRLQRAEAFEAYKLS